MPSSGEPRVFAVGRRRVKVSRPEKVLFPDDGITKADLAAYYERIAAAMLPHVRARPVMLQRFPNGIGSRPIVQQKAREHFPSWVHRVTVERETGGTITHATIDDAATLVYLADQACITPHVWLSRGDRPRNPDQMVFDLDPPEDGFSLVLDAARVLREALEDLGLVPFVRTSGSRGLHVHVPLDRRAGFDRVRALSRRIARDVAEARPGRFTVEQRKAERDGRLYLDVMRNGYGQTVVAPYAVRPRPGAPVATPLDWSELDRRLRPERFTLQTVPRRVERDGDPWEHMRARARSLARMERRLGRDGS
jgi:bifunctional non-homologous end joining protein LigD